MIGVPVGVATQMLSRRTSNDEETLGTLLCCLRRSLVGEAIDDQLWDSLDAVLGELAPPAPHEMAAIADRFRTSTTKLVKVVPYLVRPYPVRQMQRLIFLSAERPRAQGARSHLNRFAMGILAVLELMGDDAL